MVGWGGGAEGTEVGGSGTVTVTAGTVTGSVTGTVTVSLSLTVVTVSGAIGGFFGFREQNPQADEKFWKATTFLVELPIIRPCPEMESYVFLAFCHPIS